MLHIPRPLGLLLLALLLATVFVPTWPPTMYWQRVLQDAGHGMVFAGVAIVLLAMRSPDRQAERRSGREYAQAFGIAVALGVVTEWLQVYLPDRHVSVTDALHDAAGAMLGLAVVALAERRVATDRAVFRYAVACALGALVFLSWEPLRCARVYAERSRSFPTLAPMGTLADAQFVGGRNATVSHAPLPTAWRRPGEGAALRLSYAPGARPALELAEAAPDWRGHAVLALDLTNPADAPANFILRVLDRRHDWTHQDRLNLPVIVPPATRTTVRVSMAAIADAPVAREMDLAAIANVMLFATRPLPGETFYVSGIWLEE
jgi:hypothetical protein